MMESQKPLHLGLTRAGDQLPPEVVQAHQLRVSSATRLVDLLPQYKFYTAALLFLYVPLRGQDPYHDFLDQHGGDGPRLTLEFDRPLFSGMPLDWASTLFAMEHAQWEKYVAWMGTLAFLDRQQQTLVRLRTRDVMVVDALALLKEAVSPEKCPLIPVTVFCLDGSRGCIYIEEQPLPLLNPPVVRRAAAFPDTKSFTRALLRGDPNPYGTVDQEVNRTDENRDVDGP